MSTRKYKTGDQGISRHEQVDQRRHARTRLDADPGVGIHNKCAHEQ